MQSRAYQASRDRVKAFAQHWRSLMHTNLKSDSAIPTKNEAARNAWMIGLGLVFVLIGGCAAYLNIQMVGAFGEGMGVDETSRVIYWRANVAVQVFGTASAFAIGSSSGSAGRCWPRWRSWRSSCVRVMGSST
jgi:hypothetical protein